MENCFSLIIGMLMNISKHWLVFPNTGQLMKFQVLILWYNLRVKLNATSARVRY